MKKAWADRESLWFSSLFRPDYKGEKMKICDCFVEQDGETYCYGTKEIDPCSCGGNPLNCTFYKYKRERALQEQKAQETAKERLSHYNVAKCFSISHEEFERILTTIHGCECEINYTPWGFQVIGELETFDLNSDLSEYFNIKVLDIHTDDCIPYNVYVVFEEKEE